MIAPLRPGAALAQINGPVIETERLILRQWRGADIAPNTAMLADPDTARFITADRKPVTDALNGWRNAAIMAGHWVLYGAGMFVVEEKSSGLFTGRVGPWFPPSWPGFEVGWGIAKEFRGKGYAVDRMIDVLKRNGVAIALVSAAGSSIYGMGAPPDNARRRSKALRPSIRGRRTSKRMTLGRSPSATTSAPSADPTVKTR